MTQPLSSARTAGARRASMAVLAIGLPLAGLVLVLPDLAGFRFKIVLLVAAIGALVSGLRMHDPPNRRPWLLMIAGLMLISAGDVVVLIVSADQIVASNVPADAWLTAIGGAVLLAAMFDITRHAHGLDAGGVLDALLLAVAVWTVLWQLVIMPVGAPGWAGSGTELAGGLQVLLFVAILGLMIRTVRTAPRGARRAGLLLVAAVALGLTAFLVGATREASSGVAHYAGLRAALGAGAHLLAAAAALHPSMQVLSEDRVAPSEGFTLARTIAVGLALSTPPAVLLVSMWRGAEVGSTSLVVSGLILIPMVLTRLHLLGRARDAALAHADATERRMRSLVAHTGDLLLLVEHDRHARIVHANPASVRLVGQEPAALVGTSIRDLVVDDDHVGLDVVLLGPDPTPRSADVRVRRPDGELRWMEIVGDVYDDEAGPALVLTLRDVTERKHTEMSWLAAAHRDALTGLANRRGLEQRLDDDYARVATAGGRIGVLLCDLDGFKPINDAAGHGIGDAVLRNLSTRFARVIRDEDLLGRLGGDEFLVVCSDVQAPERLDEVASRLLAAASAPVTVDGQRFQLGMSVGIATTGGQGPTEELLHRADVALYRAKQRGRGRAEWADPEEQLAVTPTA